MFGANCLTGKTRLAICLIRFASLSHSARPIAITVPPANAFPMTQRAPEIFQTPLADLAIPGAPPRGTPEFEQSVITHFALDYARRGWNALVTVDADFVRCVAVPEQGIEPKDYVLGLLRAGFLEDALPLLQALSGMLADADIEYNYGICLSELGRIADSLAPLQRCLALDADYVNAWIGQGVALARLGRDDEAATSLREALRRDPGNALAQRNLAAVEARARDGAEEAGAQAKSLKALETLHARTDGRPRMDAVFYMQGALERFAAMSREEIGKAVMEIALLGRQGLKINDPEKRYTLKSLPGDYSGLQLLATMHAGIRLFDASADTGTCLDREYELAVAMQGKKTGAS